MEKTHKSQEDGPTEDSDDKKASTTTTTTTTPAETIFREIIDEFINLQSKGVKPSAMLANITEYAILRTIKHRESVSAMLYILSIGINNVEVYNTSIPKRSSAGTSTSRLLTNEDNQSVRGGSASSTSNRATLKGITLTSIAQDMIAQSQKSAINKLTMIGYENILKYEIRCANDFFAESELMLNQMTVIETHYTKYISGKSDGVVEHMSAKHIHLFLMHHQAWVYDNHRLTLPSKELDRILSNGTDKIYTSVEVPMLVECYYTSSKLYFIDVKYIKDKCLLETIYPDRIEILNKILVRINNQCKTNFYVPSMTKVSETSVEDYNLVIFKNPTHIGLVPSIVYQTPYDAIGLAIGFTKKSVLVAVLDGEEKIGCINIYNTRGIQHQLNVRYSRLIKDNDSVIQHFDPFPIFLKDIKTDPNNADMYTATIISQAPGNIQVTQHRQLPTLEKHRERVNNNMGNVISKASIEDIGMFPNLLRSRIASIMDTDPRNAGLSAFMAMIEKATNEYNKFVTQSGAVNDLDTPKDAPKDAPKNAPKDDLPKDITNNVAETLSMKSINATKTLDITDTLETTKTIKNNDASKIDGTRKREATASVSTLPVSISAAGTSAAGTSHETLNESDQASPNKRQCL